MSDESKKTDQAPDVQTPVWDDDENDFFEGIEGVAMPQPEAVEPEEKKKRRKWPIVVAVIILIILLLLGLVQCQSCQTGDDMEPNVTVGPMENMSQEDLQKMLDDQLEEGMLGFAINSVIVFDSPEAKGKIMFENPGNNAKLTKVEIFRDDNGELVYSTGYLQPGSYVEEDTLDVKLEPGSYPCTAYVSSYKLDSKKFIGKAAVAVVIVVE